MMQDSFTGESRLARIRKQSAWREIPFKQRHASFEISIGNERCSGGYLKAQLEWASQEFTSFEFSIGDTLQAHNYVAIGHPVYGPLSPERAHLVSAEEGESWFQENLPIVQSILPLYSYTFRRWPEWLALDEVQGNLNHLWLLMDQQANFKSLILSDVQAFLSRRGLAFGELNPRTLNELIAYLLEELAVYQYQADRPPCVNIYPGSTLKVFKQLSDSELLPESLRSRHYVLLDVR